MNVNDKIKQILIDKSLSPSVFADEIGVQRSSISHILSGRNRPSFDIIQKVIRRYPDLGYDWIMEDDGQENKHVPKPGIRSPNETSSSATRQSLSPTQRRQPMAQPGNLSAASPTGSMVTPPAIISEKTVERILIFHTDGTFREYTPAS